MSRILRTKWLLQRSYTFLTFSLLETLSDCTSRPMFGGRPDMRGVVLNYRGRVLADTSEDSALLHGVYVCGWLKRGPTGIIGTNLHCAEETIASISEDLEKGSLASDIRLPKPNREGLLQILDNRNVKVIPFSGWEKIDAEEKRRGNLSNKPREKLTTWEELLEVSSK